MSLSPVRALPRDLHPGAWWLWALGLATAASFVFNPLICLLLCAVAGFVVSMRRSQHGWALSFRYYVYFGVLIVVLRVAFRIVLGGASPADDVVLFTLPQIPLPELARGIDLLGPFTLTEFTSSLYDGIRLATIVICVGAANSLANPRRLLKSVPSALYEVGTAIVVAISVFPQLAESVQRVHRARRLRGEPGKGVRFLRRLVVPVLEDALERSLTLAASMDARGYGRTGSASPRERLVTGTFMVVGIVAICVGAYGILDGTAPRWLAGPMAAAGVTLAVVALMLAGRGVTRTQYRPQSWRFAEFATAATGVIVAWGMYVYRESALAVAYPAFDTWPSLSLVGALIVLVGIVPAFVAPIPLDDRNVPEIDAADPAMEPAPTGGAR